MPDVLVPSSNNLSSFDGGSYRDRLRGAMCKLHATLPRASPVNL
ncbi:unnamed protein product [Schistocephalus solidus]|uniref:Uncharacterized protein n=1 Tax=Schistocephalus solidus TaxID=70667 RepID=A0A3P7D6P4_SCHSO|nr:unnamed protein product [Schistocephalus solidus]